MSWLLTDTEHDDEDDEGVHHGEDGGGDGRDHLAQLLDSPEEPDHPQRPHQPHLDGVHRNRRHYYTAAILPAQHWPNADVVQGDCGQIK